MEYVTSYFPMRPSAYCPVIHMSQEGSAVGVQEQEPHMQNGFNVHQQESLTDTESCHYR